MIYLSTNYIPVDTCFTNFPDLREEEQQSAMLIVETSACMSLSALLTGYQRGTEHYASKIMGSATSDL